MQPNETVRARYNVRETGTGTAPMLFAHGFGCDQAMWRFVAPHFEATHRVVRFDYPGHGDGALEAFDPARHATLHGYGDDLLAVCEALDLEDVVLVAHSVSATVALLAAQRAPERFARLVLVCPSPCYTNDPPDYHGGFERADLEGMIDLMRTNFTAWAGALAPVIAGNPNEPSHAQELEASFCRTDHAVACTFAQATFLSDHRRDLAGVTTPSLVLQCSDDVIAPEAVGRFVASTLPDSTFYHMAATGHCPHLTHPAETIAAITHYLALPPGVPLPMGGR